ncbi:hypothetical protein Brms1b_013404 [Colletotrichum noveboracense]|nr:hypothetical protein Brms1b_013404 [Colletotrichum noveboracense]
MVFSKLSSRFGGQNATIHKRGPVDVEASDSEHSIIRDGDLAYTLAKGGNGSKPAYQEAVGAPVEKHSPLGYHVGWITVIFLNVNQMIGTGIFSTPASVLNGTGSVGLAFIYWTIGFLMALAGLSVYLELASYFPNRRKTPSAWELKGVAIAAYTFAVICVVAHNKYSLWATNIIGAIKIITLIFISITGLVVLGGHVGHIPDPNANFRNSFEGTTDNGNDLATALVNIIFSYTGYSNAFNVVNEIKNPIPVLKRHATISVVVVAVLYMFCNVAYVAAVPKAEFKTAKEIAAAVFFTKVFGTGPAEQALNFLVLLSAFGNLLGVLIGSSRVIREIGRQGVLPWTEFWVNTKPFGTPIGPYFLKWIMTFIMIAAPPAGDAFQFVISLKTYPDGLFHFAMAVGVYLIRVRRKRAGLGRTEFKSWHVTVIFFILLQVYILVMPWWPPKGGPYAGNVSFWYATYCVVGIAM